LLSLWYIQIFLQNWLFQYVISVYLTFYYINKVRGVQEGLVVKMLGLKRVEVSAIRTLEEKGTQVLTPWQYY
jgi:hypothetical protein